MRISPMDDSGISRRLFLLAADVAILDTPRGMLDTYIRMTGDTSGKPYIGCYSGHLFAVQPNDIVEPLCGFTGFGLGWDRPQANGDYHHAWKEVGYYTDLRGGEILEQWRNPLNGELCDVMHIHNRSVNMKLTTTVNLPPPGSNRKIGYSNFPQLDNPVHPYGLPYAILDDQLSIFYDGRGYVPSPLDPKTRVRESAGAMMSVAEFFMLTSRKSEALNPKVTSAACTGSWTRIGPWLPWMLLGQRPGHLFYRSATTPANATRNFCNFRPTSACRWNHRGTSSNANSSHDPEHRSPAPSITTTQPLSTAPGSFARSGNFCSNSLRHVAGIDA